ADDVDEQQHERHRHDRHRDDSVGAACDVVQGPPEHHARVADEMRVHRTGCSCHRERALSLAPFLIAEGCARTRATRDCRARCPTAQTGVRRSGNVASSDLEPAPPTRPAENLLTSAADDHLLAEVAPSVVLPSPSLKLDTVWLRVGQRAQWCRPEPTGLIWQAGSARQGKAKLRGLLIRQETVLHRSYYTAIRH